MRSMLSDWTVRSGSSFLILIMVFASVSSAAVIDVTSYGATGNGVTDDTDAIIAAMENLSDNDTLLFPLPSSYYNVRYTPEDLVVPAVADVGVEGLDAGETEGTEECAARALGHETVGEAGCPIPVVAWETASAEAAGAPPAPEPPLGVVPREHLSHAPDLLTVGDAAAAHDADVVGTGGELSIAPVGGVGVVGDREVPHVAL